MYHIYLHLPYTSAEWLNVGEFSQGMKYTIPGHMHGTGWGAGWKTWNSQFRLPKLDSYSSTNLTLCQTYRKHILGGGRKWQVVFLVDESFPLSPFEHVN